MNTVASFPGSLEHEMESLVYFLKKHDIIKIRLKHRKATLMPGMVMLIYSLLFFCALFNQLCVQRSVCMIFNPQQLDTCSKLVATLALFPVLSLRICPRTISFYHLSTSEGSHMRKNYQALSSCTTSISCS